MRTFKAFIEDELGRPILEKDISHYAHLLEKYKTEEVSVFKPSIGKIVSHPNFGRGRVINTSWSNKRGIEAPAAAVTVRYTDRSGKSTDIIHKPEEVENLGENYSNVWNDFRRQTGSRER